MSSYASPTDLVNYGVNAAALATFTTPQQQAALDTAAQLLDGYLGARFTLPLVVWGNDIRRACAIIAAYDLMMSRGLDPDGSMADVLKTRFDSVEDWLKRIARQEVTPLVTDSGAIATTDHGGSGAFTRQMTISQGQPVDPGLSLSGGAPPNVSESNVGTVTVGAPRSRGW